MDRRTVLVHAAAGFSLGTAGCLADNGDGEGNETPTESGGPDRPEDVFVVLHNGAAEQVTVSVTITAENSLHFEERTSVEPGGMTSLYPDITEQSRYEITVATDGLGEERFDFEFGEYDLEMGSNVVVWIDDDIRIGKED
jgi:hypothetical protein